VEHDEDDGDGDGGAAPAPADVVVVVVVVVVAVVVDEADDGDRAEEALTSFTPALTIPAISRFPDSTSTSAIYAEINAIQPHRQMKQEWKKERKQESKQEKTYSRPPSIRFVLRGESERAQRRRAFFLLRRSSHTFPWNALIMQIHTICAQRDLHLRHTRRVAGFLGF
jgi:hypothetical protein